MMPFRGETTLPPLGSKWPFPSVNGEQTLDSVALVTAKQPKPLTPQSGSSRILSQYETVMTDPDTEEALL